MLREEPVFSKNKPSKRLSNPIRSALSTAHIKSSAIYTHMHVHTYTCKIRKEEIMNFRENMESIGGAKSERLMYEILSNNNKKEPCKKKRKKKA